MEQVGILSYGGGVHALYQIIEDVKNLLFKKLPLNENKEQTFSVRLRKRITTFILVDFAWIFFVSDSFMHALGAIKQMFKTFQTANFFDLKSDPSKWIYLGLNPVNWFLIMFSIVVLMYVDILHEKGKSIFAIVNQQEFWFRWILYLGLIWSIIMFGIYGQAYDASTFIYFQF